MSHAAAKQDSIASLLKSEVVATPLFFPKYTVIDKLLSLFKEIDSSSFNLTETEVPASTSISTSDSEAPLALASLLTYLANSYKSS